MSISHSRAPGRRLAWLHYDKVLQGTYEYDAQTGAVKTGDNKIDASFDAKPGILIWGKHKYKAAKDEKSFFPATKRFRDCAQRAARKQLSN